MPPIGPKAQVIALTVGFRVPAAVVALANRLLEALEVDVPQTRCFRADGRLRVEKVPDLPRAIVTAVHDALRHEGSIAVIAADAAIEKLAMALRNEGITMAEAGAPGGLVRVTLVPATMAKGLEYDHVGRAGGHRRSRNPGPQPPLRGPHPYRLTARRTPFPPATAPPLTPGEHVTPACCPSTSRSQTAPARPDSEVPGQPTRSARIVAGN
jgi:hypothetical protein